MPVGGLIAVDVMPEMATLPLHGVPLKRQSANVRKGELKGLGAPEGLVGQLPAPPQAGARDPTAVPMLICSRGSDSNPLRHPQCLQHEIL